MYRALGVMALLALGSSVIAAESFDSTHIGSNSVSQQALGCGIDKALPFVPVEAKTEPRNAGYFLFTVKMGDVDKASQSSGGFSRAWDMPLNSGDYYYRGDYKSVFSEDLSEDSLFDLISLLNLEEKSTPLVSISKMNDLPSRVRFSPERQKTSDLYRQVFSDQYPDMSHLTYETSRGTIIYPGRIRQIDNISENLETWFLYEVCEKDVGIAQQEQKATQMGG